MSRRETSDAHRHVRAVIPASAVRAAGVAASPGQREEATGPRVELVRENGVVRAIDVTCGCGERFRIVCEYDA
jgi:hypothetical protein